jgi:pyruvate formate lyase activating enzyme
MKIGGLQKLTLVDYPGKVAATVFLIGCNFKCGFCHNPDLVNWTGEQKEISEKDFFEFLKEKEGLIEGVCITGGEPTIYPDLNDFIKRIKDMGFLVKLDTNGSNPDVVSKLIEKKLVDFIAMDIKTSLEKYGQATNSKIDAKNIKKSVELIKNSGIDYEFRTTVVPGLVEKEDIEKIGKWLRGAKKIALQQFQNKRVLDKNFREIQPYSDEALNEFKEVLGKNIKEVELRL